MGPGQIFGFAECIVSSEAALEDLMTEYPAPYLTHSPKCLSSGSSHGGQGEQLGAEPAADGQDIKHIHV